MKVRQQCVEMLERILENKVFLNNIKKQVDVQHRPFANMLLLTTLRRYEALEQILAKFLHKKISGKDKKLYYVLLLGAAEILYLNTPEYAAINEYVNIAKKYTNRFAVGMVNAVLRQINKQKNSLNTAFKDTYFSNSFKQLLAKDYTKTQIIAMEKMVGTEPPLDISSKQFPEVWAKDLNGVLLENGTIRLPSASKVAELAGFDEGQWWVQDLAASLPILLLGDVKEKKTLDLCAAPGGKTAQLLAAGAKVTAVDVDEGRMEKLKENIERLNLANNLQTIVSDAILFLNKCYDAFDIIVVDAPCSATGTFRRHPEILHNKTLADVKEQTEKQKIFLQAAAKKLKSGGKMLFCTCSIAKDEGEYQIDNFLNENSDFVLCPANLKMLQRYNGIKLDEKIIDKGVLRTLPYYMENMGGMDAFFAACLQKK